MQDYLKNIFDKVGVRTRRELGATVFRDPYRPWVLASDRAGASGFFDTRHGTPGATSGPPIADRPRCAAADRAAHTATQNVHSCALGQPRRPTITGIQNGGSTGVTFRWMREVF